MNDRVRSGEAPNPEQRHPDAVASSSCLVDTSGGGLKALHLAELAEPQLPRRRTQRERCGIYGLGRRSSSRRTGSRSTTWRRSSAEVVSFHEMCVTGYSFLQDATKERLLSLAEFVPAGPSCVALHEIAFEVGVPILAGLLEVEKETGALYNTCVLHSVARAREKGSLDLVISPDTLESIG
jgi:hypothetical protein